MSSDLPEPTSEPTPEVEPPTAPQPTTAGPPTSPGPPMIGPTTMSSPYPAPVVHTNVPARRGLGLLGTMLIAGLVAAVVGAFAGIAGYAMGRSLDTREPSSAVAEAGEAIAAPPIATGSIAQIAGNTLPSVVSLIVGDAGSGSGFVIRPDGYILTNNHVVSVSSGNTVEVVFADGDRRTGRVVGTSPSYDLAVVKVDRADLPSLDLGDSDRVRVGDVVVAIGAPLGLDGTVTSGIVSALDRPVMAGESASDVSYINAVQTDAAINPGNSGGPLLDTAGNVIGVNSAIATLAIGGEAGNIGLGFAIPSNSAARVAKEIIATGSSRTPLMGVQLDPSYSDTGARVSSVTPGSGAEQVGVETGDIVLAVDGRTIEDATELVVAIRSYAPGDTIMVDLERDGRPVQVEIVLGDDSE